MSSKPNLFNYLWSIFTAEAFKHGAELTNDSIYEFQKLIKDAISSIKFNPSSFREFEAALRQLAKSLGEQGDASAPGRKIEKKQLYEVLIRLSWQWSETVCFLFGIQKSNLIFDISSPTKKLKTTPVKVRPLTKTNARGKFVRPFRIPTGVGGELFAPISNSGWVGGVFNESWGEGSIDSYEGADNSAWEPNDNEENAITFSEDDLDNDLDIEETLIFPGSVSDKEESTPQDSSSTQDIGHDNQDPPRSAYAVLNCPEIVLAEEEFELETGLSKESSPGVVGDPLVRPSTSIGPYFLTIQLVAEGFLLRSGESWRQNIIVSTDKPYPRITLHLHSEPQDQEVRPRAVRAIYSIDGQTVGMAFRPIAVVKDAVLLSEKKAAGIERGVDISIPTDLTKPDLTVQIFIDQEIPGKLLWTFETPYTDIPTPKEACKSFIGNTPRDFARKLVNTVNAKEGKPGLFEFLRGIGVTIAKKMPPVFLDLLTAVHGKKKEIPLVLLLSEEPYIPWELALIETVFDPGAQPFLAAQTNMGRWVLGNGKPLPPPLQVNIRDMAVIWGIYDRQPGWQRLFAAEQEAQDLRTEYGASSIDAEAATVLSCLNGTPPADILHFAVHGIYDPQSSHQGLVLVDDNYIDPMQIKGSVLKNAPFIFLNACQVGSGDMILGDYAGMAEAFLSAGASAVLAPLWSVKDTLAKDIAIEFYKKTFAGQPAGEVLRHTRRRYSQTEKSSATCLAYQFFGHPGLKLRREISSQGDLP